LVRFRAVDGVLPEWALIVFRAQLSARRYMKLVTITTNIAHLGAQRFAAIEFPLPEQRRIVAEVDRRLSVLDAIGVSVDANLARCARLRQSILKRAFKGRLIHAHDRQVLDSEPAGALGAEASS
jgi:type I restriction enzyme S subunit